MHNVSVIGSIILNVAPSYFVTREKEDKKKERIQSMGEE
jgi:hypothetical protein